MTHGCSASLRRIEAPFSNCRNQGRGSNEQVDITPVRKFYGADWVETILRGLFESQPGSVLFDNTGFSARARCGLEIARQCLLQSSPGCNEGKPSRK